MVLVAENISNYFESAMEMLGSLKDSIETSNFAMNNIVDSTESTAEADEIRQLSEQNKEAE